MLDTHSDGYVAVTPEDVGVKKPAVLKSSRFCLPHQVAGAFWGTLTFERDAKLHNQTSL
jgi:hypothetical protein